MLILQVLRRRYKTTESALEGNICCKDRHTCRHTCQSLEMRSLHVKSSADFKLSLLAKQDKSLVLLILTILCQLSLGRLYLKMAFRPDFSNQTLVRIHSTLQIGLVILKLKIFI